MGREREDAAPKVLDADKEMRVEEESRAGQEEKAVKPDEALRSLEPQNQIVPEEEKMGPALQPRRRGLEGQPSETEEKKDTSDVYQLLLDAVHHNANRLNRRLRQHLTGRIQFIIRGTDQAYLLDWRSEELCIQAGREQEVDCCIEISAGDLFDIARGDLNPQIAILSDKVRVTGEARMAVYLFNLFVAQ